MRWHRDGYPAGSDTAYTKEVERSKTVLLTRR